MRDTDQVRECRIAIQFKDEGDAAVSDARHSTAGQGCRVLTVDVVPGSGGGLFRPQWDHIHALRWRHERGGAGSGAADVYPWVWTQSAAGVTAGRGCGAQ